MRKSITLERCVYVTAVISLFFTITNLLPVSAMISMGIVILPVIFLYKRITAPGYVFSLIVLLAFFFISAVIYEWPQVFQYGFYRRDGNAFATFAPVLALSFFHIKCNPEKITARFLGFATFANFVCIIIWLITGDILGMGSRNEYHFLFIAHNACGGFLSTVIAFATAFYITKRRRKYFLYILINGAGLYFSGSRGSIIGITLGLAIYYWASRRKKDPTVDIKIIVGMIFAITLIEIYIYHTLKMSGIDIAGNKEGFFLPAIFEEKLMDLAGYIRRSGTIILRVFHLWPYAVMLFLYSPLMGTGFGSYNDFPFSMEGIKYVFCYKVPGAVINSDSHAHNTYLHVLAENGIAGMILLLIFLVKLKKYISQIQNKTLKTALHIGLLSILISSFTEHRLFVPSQVLPFTIILGLVTADRNARKYDICSGFRK